MHTSQQNKRHDKFYSTYYWKIKLDPTHPYNNPRVAEITGYSKKEGWDEARNKEHLLMGCMVRLAKNGYLNRIREINVYRRKGEIVNTREDVLLFTLFPKTFQPEPFFLKQVDFCEFLFKLYKCVVKGEDPGYLLPKAKPGFSKDDLFKVELYNFRSITQLVKQCERFLHNGHPNPVVEQFYRNYLEKNEGLTQTLF